jgi:hypothetical protein
VATYAANVGLAALLDGLLELVAARDRLEGAQDPRSQRSRLAGSLFAAGVFFASIAVAYAVSPSAGKWMWLLLLVPTAIRHARAGEVPRTS